jgi:hypothetical protein
MSSKRQTTMAKLQRERRVEERRTLKREKKQAAAAARRAGDQPSALTEQPFGLTDEQWSELTDEQRAVLVAAHAREQDAETSAEPGAAQPPEISAKLDGE